MKLEMGKLEIMTYVYTFIIFVMVGLAVLQAFKLNFNGYSLSFMIGALFFGLSDLILAPIYFKNEKKPYVYSSKPCYLLSRASFNRIINFIFIRRGFICLKN